MDSRRWWMTGRYRIENPSSQSGGTYLYCPFCPKPGFTLLASAHSYAVHYARKHLSLNGLISVPQIKDQTVRWDIERAKKAGVAFTTWGALNRVFGNYSRIANMLE